MSSSNNWSTSYGHASVSYDADTGLSDALTATAGPDDSAIMTDDSGSNTPNSAQQTDLYRPNNTIPFSLLNFASGYSTQTHTDLVPLNQDTFGYTNNGTYIVIDTNDFSYVFRSTRRQDRELEEDAWVNAVLNGGAVWATMDSRRHVGSMGEILGPRFESERNDPSTGAWRVDRVNNVNRVEDVDGREAVGTGECMLFNMVGKTAAVSAMVECQNRVDWIRVGASRMPLS
ncbi:uncharacterized protein L203_100737 [Cryptococcus depauperatus CBS 7841]|uniref:Uncharacterized protein n=1 Tax=Cryptococcus depauperatus CBS 7841 TaxID=1295531 RepID=A0A1E3IXU6_9TREE|nr:hypothetical protein L203_00526 [Cryptococcus depauperatus CBS 7841]